MHFPSFAATALLLLSGIAPTLSAPVPATSCKPKRESAGKGKPNLLSDIFPSPTSTEADDVPTAMTTGASHTKSSHASVTTGKASATASFDAPEPSASASTSPSSGNGARFVLYTDSSVSTKNGLPSPSDIKGYNVLALSFLLASGPADQAQQWVSLSASERESALQAYHDAGIKLIVSAFGETETPTTSGTDAAATAQKMAAWVKKYNLDGIDVDYEDFKAFESQPDKAIQWLVTFTKTLRQELPAGQYTISHAPVAPWFTKDSYKGGYFTVDQKAGDDIDWYNVQFYNQGEDMYTDCTGLLNKAGSSFPGTSLFEIADAGIPLDKLVIGKPGAASQASNGFLSQATLASCVSKAQDKGWNGGVMTWEYPSGKASFISAVRGSVFPL